ncbi:MAG: Zn-dependent exopeptidase [Monoraphidium minutum]|nr:MAG: Zn-dependent exopeptidase [Monoraphidium minutum]
MHTPEHTPAHTRAQKLRDECLRGAKYLARLLEGLGCEVRLAAHVEGKNPVVMGRLGFNPAHPTVVFYGHYDVQPALEPDWGTRPFELAAVDGYLYGRGTSDNKGPVLAFIYAVKEMLDCWQAAGGVAPLNVAFIIEGEEENGSTGFREALTANLGWFSDADVVVISNTVWVGERLPCLTYGMRGMVTASIEVTGPARDVHSGNDGGVFSEPMADLFKLLAGRAIAAAARSAAAFAAAVPAARAHRPPRALAPLTPPDRPPPRRAIGVPRLTAPPNKHDLLVARWCQPSLSVVDVRAGGAAPQGGRSLYRFGPTRFSVIPRSAVGKVSIRFVPEQDASHLIAALTAHVRAQFEALGSANSVDVRVHSVGDWWEADPESDVFKMAERAVRREWGVAPLYVREGGTMPVASLIEKLLGAPALLIPMGQSSDSCHLANERLRRLNLVKGKNVVRHLMEELAAAAPAAAAVPGMVSAAAPAAPGGGGGAAGGGALPSALAPPAAGRGAA